jgi:hypothetical protein
MNRLVYYSGDNTKDKASAKGRQMAGKNAKNNLIEKGAEIICVRGFNNAFGKMNDKVAAFLEKARGNGELRVR